MAITLTYDFRGLLELDSALRGLLDSFPALKRELIRNIASRWRSVILNRILIQDIRYTGTYEQSLKIIPGGSETEPNISLVLDPTGPQAARLPIYWKVLEFGANPSPNVLSSAIVDWATVKFGDPAAGFRIANSIRSRGINPHPILSSIFVLTPPDGEVAGLTGRGESIVLSEGEKMLDRLQSSWQTQPRIPKGMPGGGQFTFRI